MKISNRLIIAVSMPLLLALIVCVALWVSYRTTLVAQRNGDTVRQMRSSIADLNGIVYSYILNHGERPKQQFAAAYSSLAGRIADFNLRDAGQRDLLGLLRNDIEAINVTFLRLVSNYETARASGDTQLLDEAETVVTGQLLVALHDADENASFLRSAVDADISRSQTRTFILITVVVLISAAVLTYVLTRIRSRVVSSIGTLQKGAETVGAGNLDFKIEETAGDEIGNLSRTFNRMAANLKSVTASKADLEKEMAARQSAEEELRVTNEMLQDQTVELESEIEERKKAAGALQKRTSELEAANKELEAFSYSVSHDLRTPLRALDGFSEAVLTDYGDRLDETGQSYLIRIRKASQTMSQLIDDLLKLSRVSRAEMRTGEVDLSALARSICEELQAGNGSRRVEFSIAPAESTKADKNLLTIALRNLLENAWKYTVKCEKARIEFGVSRENGDRFYFVRDNGIGFDMRYAGKLFEPFQRLHDDKEYPGTGIGLATVQRIIRRHGGRVWAESSPGKGTTFYFTLG